MMKKMLWKEAITIVLVVLVAAPAVHADSLWRRRSPQRAHLFEDALARRVGDLLTIVISESSQVTNRENNSMSKATSTGSAFEMEAGSGGGFGTSSASASLDHTTSSDREFDGDASYNDSRVFNDQITVTVVDVLPNGNLVVSGKRCLMIAGEKRTLVVSGIVRPNDISQTNAVNSRLVGDFRSVYDGVGPSRKFTHQGWLGRTVNKIWPF